MPFNSQGNCRHRRRWEAFDQLPRVMRDALNGAVFNWCSACYLNEFRHYVRAGVTPEEVAAHLAYVILSTDTIAVRKREHAEQNRALRQRLARRAP